jgi:hypothetical protein
MNLENILKFKGIKPQNLLREIIRKSRFLISAEKSPVFITLSYWSFIEQRSILWFETVDNSRKAEIRTFISKLKDLIVEENFSITKFLIEKNIRRNLIFKINNNDDFLRKLGVSDKSNNRAKIEKILNLHNEFLNDIVKNVYFIPLKSYTLNRATIGILVINTNFDYPNESLRLLEDIAKALISPIYEAESDYLIRFHSVHSASTSIIVDSFSHNIAAHCLVALISHFKNRLKEIPEQLWTFFTSIDKKNENEFYNIISNSDFYKKLEREDRELVNFLSFIRGKSAFWSGGIGFQSPGGIIMNFYDILNQFVDNSLFLGTIAYSEGYEGVMIKVNNKLVSCSTFKDGVIRYMFDITQGKEKLHGIEKLDKIKLRMKNFKAYKKDFQKWQLFLPGGVVGLQSLYTFWENILRNIKHISGNKDKIITFHIQVKEQKSIFKITSYLESNVDNPKKALMDIKNSFKRGIIDTDGKAIMGGSSLMLLCAGFLRGLTPFQIYTLVRKKYESLVKIFEDEAKIKYTIEVWKGDYYVEWKRIKEKIKSGYENIYRYKILICEDDEEKEVLDLEKPPIRRVKNIKIEQFKKNGTQSEEIFWKLYREWLKEWIFDDKISVEFMAYIKSWQKNENFNNEKKFVFRHINEENELDPNRFNIGFKSHGLFIEEFSERFKGENLYDLYEILGTRITIIDDRIYKKYKDLSKKQQEILTKVLSVGIYPEKKTKQSLFNVIFKKSKQHFLVIHLSNVETARDDSGKKIWKNNIRDFANEVLKNYRFLVFTSGRNRAINKKQFGNNKGKIFFIHLENFLQIFDWGMEISEEAAFRIKYGLIKLLIGI